PQGGVESALEPASVRAAPRASTPSTKSTFLVAISTLLACGLSSDRASRARDPLSGTPRIAWRGQVRLNRHCPDDRAQSRLASACSADRRCAASDFWLLLTCFGPTRCCRSTPR